MLNSVKRYILRKKLKKEKIKILLELAEVKKKLKMLDKLDEAEKK